MKKDDSHITTISGRKISKIERYKWTMNNKPGDFEWIDKDELSIDYDYQRDTLNNERINDFAAHWCWIKCGVLLVVIRDNEWFVVDGQHRKLAADKRSDIKKLPCMVYELDGVDKEARAFVDINSGRTSVSSYNKFRAMIVAKDETAIGLDALIKTTGHYYAKSNGLKAVRCLMTMWNIYIKNKNVITDLWPLIADIHQDCSLTDAVIKSIYGSELIARKVGCSLLNSPIKSFLIKCGGEYIAAEIQKEKNITGLGGSRIEVNALIKLINKQRIMSKSKLPLVE